MLAALRTASRANVKASLQPRRNAIEHLLRGGMRCFAQQNTQNALIQGSSRGLGLEVVTQLLRKTDYKCAHTNVLGVQRDIEADTSQRWCMISYQMHLAARARTYSAPEQSHHGALFTMHCTSIAWALPSQTSTLQSIPW